MLLAMLSDHTANCSVYDKKVLYRPHHITITTDPKGHGGWGLIYYVPVHKHVTIAGEEEKPRTPTEESNCINLYPNIIKPHYVHC